jgi:hypothetical protein
MVHRIHQIRSRPNHPLISLLWLSSAHLFPKSSGKTDRVPVESDNKPSEENMKFRNFAAVLLSVSAIALAPIAAQASTGKDIKSMAIEMAYGDDTIEKLGADGAKALVTMYNMIPDNFYEKLDGEGFQACRDVVKGQLEYIAATRVIREKLAKTFHPLAKNPKEIAVAKDFTLTLATAAVVNNCGESEQFKGVYLMRQ